MKNKLLPAVLIGAAIGAALSLIDKNTRSTVMSSTKDLKYYAQNPNEAKEKLTSDAGDSSKVQSLKDEVMFWKDTIQEIRQNNPELEESIKDAKDTFMKKREQKQLN
ncbi:YtxH domain-containing protein [Salinicoccus sp. ID82-1]|uniref:YtxH domain-containing protein n=1 Tax=Salinicoccus cyprini TaxID=2493691 RepID=A0A558ATP2_9STAP|nr:MULTISPECIES: YtxH domain-containing protein [Salinicoccus]MCG1010949.1 YtxH domain-containing protein [Salinicoccus sp. ID82-1]TVT27621.1 YtxH domain-containing protein [Salinicoccus cyprini]